MWRRAVLCCNSVVVAKSVAHQLSSIDSYIWEGTTQKPLFGLALREKTFRRPQPIKTYSIPCYLIVCTLVRVLLDRSNSWPCNQVWWYVWSVPPSLCRQNNRQLVAGCTNPPNLTRQLISWEPLFDGEPNGISNPWHLRSAVKALMARRPHLCITLVFVCGIRSGCLLYICSVPVACIFLDCDMKHGICFLFSSSYSALLMCIVQAKFGQKLAGFVLFNLDIVRLGQKKTAI